jgi:hypothetical protein
MHMDADTTQLVQLIQNFFNDSVEQLDAGKADQAEG